MNDDILLVDDDPGTIRVLAAILADVGNLRSPPAARTRCEWRASRSPT
jgi:CheY-like chemotaxis protein